MKTMTCNQLGGACDVKFTANTFEEMAELSRKHGMEMAEKKDAAHLAKMAEMQQLMQKPEAMQERFQGKQAEFNALSED